MRHIGHYIIKKKIVVGFMFVLWRLQRRRGVGHGSVQPGGGEAPHAGDEIQRVPAAPGVPPQAPRDGSQDQHGGYRQQRPAQKSTRGSSHVPDREM